MAGVQACLQPLEGPARPGPSYGDVAGSSPNWGANFCDNGRKHTVGPSSDLASTGFRQFYNDTSSAERPARRHVEQHATTSYAEPVVAGAHGSYYGRRAVSDADNSSPTAFRRSLRYVPEPLHPDRPEGKRSIPEPYGAPPSHGRGMRPPPDEVRFQQTPSMPEPGLPRLGRPAGISGLRESDKELAFENSIGRKVRVGQDTYRGLGRAGDMSIVYGAPARAEDTPEFYKSMKDSPTFTRFVASLPPKPAVSPHERRMASLQRQAQTERQRERELVSTLEIPGVQDDD